MRTMRRTHRQVLVEVMEKEYVMEVVVEEEKGQWWGPYEKRGLEQWKVTETWRWGSVVKAWEYVEREDRGDWKRKEDSSNTTSLEI